MPSFIAYPLSRPTFGISASPRPQDPRVVLAIPSASFYSGIPVAAQLSGEYPIHAARTSPVPITAYKREPTRKGALR